MVKTMFRRINFSIGVLLLLVGMGCDRVPLLAPTSSTVTIDAQTRVVAIGGNTEVTATVIESSGTPVQNGTVVRFTTTLGRLDPVEAQTRNGVATTTFFAGNDSGMADVRATSGGAGGASTTTPGTGTNPPTTTTSTSNVVQIAVGAGAVETVTVSANPSTVSRTSNTAVTVTATVVGVGGRLLPGIPVSFSATRGTFSSNSAVTDAQGVARVTLNTNNDTTVTAVAGTKTATATITGQDGPSVQLSCAVGAATNCASVSQGQSVVFTAQRGATTSAIVSATLDFGDGSSQTLGTLASPTTVPHTYNQSGTFTARLTATDVNGETTEDTEIVAVLAPATAGVSAAVTAGRTVQATATTSVPGTQYAWTFEGTSVNFTTSTNTATFTYATAGTKTVSVTITLGDGRTVQASTQVVVP
jgi:adhesin/invasin